VSRRGGQRHAAFRPVFQVLYHAFQFPLELCHLCHDGLNCRPIFACGSAGLHGTAGGEKGLLGVITRYLQYRDGTRSASQRNRNTLIDGVHAPRGLQSINDVSNIVLANLFYRSDYIRSHYRRMKPGLPEYPAEVAQGQNWWGGADDIYPGILFMWGGLEGKVYPYGGGIP
jgi:hypothetical protein